MADRPKHLADSSLLDLSKGSVAMYVVPAMSTSDTVTLSEFTTLNRADGATADAQGLTFTVSGNVATLTTAATTNAKVYIFAQGTR